MTRRRIVRIVALAMLAKFEPPELRHALARTEAVAALCDALGWSVGAWIGATPGAGKSTLAALALAKARSGWWYRVDTCDRDPASFFADFGALAKRRLAIDLNHLPTYDPAHADALAGFARRWFRAVFMHAEAGTWIVFDNVQDADPDIARVLAVALDEAPSEVRLVFTSHGVPPSEYANAISKRRLALYDERLLAFTHDETRAVLAHAEAAHAAWAHVASGGWAAGVVMLGAGHAGVGTGPEALPASGIDRDALVFGYFGNEVYPRLDADARRVLESTVLLRDFDARVAQALSGVPEAERALDALCDRRLFVMRHGRVGDGPVRYALHGLFRAFLRTHLGEQARGRLYPPSRDALVTLGHAIDALELAVEYDDVAWVAAQLPARAEQLARSAQAVRLRTLVQRLPTALVDRDGWVAYWLGMLEVQVNELEACRWFARAFDAFTRDDDTSGKIAAVAAALFAYHAEWANFEGLDPWRAHAQHLLDGLDLDALSPVDRMRASVGIVCATLLSPAIDLSTAQARRAIDILAQSVIRPDPALDATERCIASQVVVEAYDLQGQVEEVAPLRAATEALFAEAPISELRRARWVLALGFLYFRHRSAAEAEAIWQVSEQLAESTGLRQLRTEVLRARIQRALNEGRVDDADTDIRKLGELLDGKRPMVAGFYYNFRSRLFLARRQFPEAVEAIDLAIAEVDRAKLSIDRQQFFLVTKSYALMGAGRYRDAIPIHTQLSAQFSGKQRSLAAGLIAVCEAYAAPHDADAFQRHLAEAFSHFRAASPTMFLRPLPEFLSTLCLEALEREIEPDYAREVIAKHGLKPPVGASRRWPWRIRVRLLDGFRIDIDDEPLIATGKAPKKPLELLKYLASRPSSEADIPRLLQHLWPDAEGDAARAAFDVAVSRLRKLLGVAEAVSVAEGRCALNRHLVWTDTRDLTHTIDVTRSAAMNASEVVACIDRLMSTYRAEFLRGESDAAWEVEARERYRSMFVSAAESLSENAVRAGDIDRGIGLAERAIEIEPLAEKLYGVLIRAYLAQQRVAEAKRVYRRCEQMLSVMLGVQPSREIRRLIEAG